MLDLHDIYFQAGAGVALLAVVGLTLFFLSRRKTSVRPAATVTKAPGVRDIRSVLSKTRESFSAKIDALILATKRFDSSFLESLEELLYTGDMGPRTVEKLLTSVRSKLGGGQLNDLQSVKQALYDEVLQILDGAKTVSKSFPESRVILVVGVNGVGKTTSIGKLAHFYASQNKSVLIVAGDTFRAAAADQLAAWGERARVDLYSSQQTKDPAAVAFEGVQKGIGEHKDVIIIDTAGRLHNKENLMEELKKVKRVIGKAFPGAPHEVLLVIDANSGQNALAQAKEFNEALQITGLIVTKLDGTARGGVIVGIAAEVGLGADFIGVGEQISDLQPFSAGDYAKGLLDI